MITFNFGADVQIDRFRVHVDNVLTGGVFAPTIIRLNGVSQGFTPPADGTNGWIEFTGLAETGSSHTVQLVQNASPFERFIMVSEVEFYGTVQSAIPEPGTWAMLLLGLFGVGGAMRRSSAKPRFSPTLA